MLYFLLGHTDMGFQDSFLSSSLADLAGHSEKVQGPPGIAMLLRGQGRTEVQRAIIQHSLLKSLLGTVLQDIIQLFGRVGFEHKLLLPDRAQDPRVQEVFEVEIVRDAYDPDPSTVESLVNPCELVEEAVIVIPLDKRVNLVQDDEKRRLS